MRHKTFKVGGLNCEITSIYAFIWFSTKQTGFNAMLIVTLFPFKRCVYMKQ